MNEVENTLSLGLQYLNFNIGQYVAVIGGNLFLQGCKYSRGAITDGWAYEKAGPFAPPHLLI